MKYALIGCGRIAIKHIEAMKDNELELVAVCDILCENMENLLKKFKLDKDKNIKKYTDYKKLVEENKLELVGIATESGVHAEIAIYCINRGINVIIEKPMAMNMKDANEIIRLTKKNKVVVSVCHQNRFNVAIQAAKTALEEGRFGKLSHGAINIRWNRDKSYYEQASWRGTWKQDGGALMNQCIHGIDLLRWMLGSEVAEVYGQIRQQIHDYIEAEDVGMAVVKFKNGLIGTIEGTTNVYPKNLEETLYIFGEKGTVKIGGMAANRIDIWDFADKDKTDEINKNVEEKIFNVYGNGHIKLYSDVIEAIKLKRSPYIDAIAGKNALEMVLAIYKSQKTGFPVKLPLEDFASIDMKGSLGDK